MKINVILKLVALVVALSSFITVPVDRLAGELSIYSAPGVPFDPETAGEEVATQAQATGKLVIFSGRREPLITPVLNLFRQKTGIEIVLKTGSATALAQQILQELPNPSADLFISNDSGTLEFLRLKGALQPYLSEA